MGRATGECPHLGKRLYWKDPRHWQRLPDRNHGRLPEGGLSQCPEANLNPSIDTNNMITAPNLDGVLEMCKFTVPSTGQESVNLTSQLLYKIATVTIIPPSTDEEN